jgi:hypothetical protein
VVDSLRKSKKMGFGINLIGFATANFGLGVALRNIAALLERLGIPYSALDIDPSGNRTGHDLSLRGRFLRAGEPMPHPVNLFNYNPPGIQGLMRDLPGLVKLEGRFHGCATYWELPLLPTDWPATLDAMDLVLAPIRYYRQTLELPEAIPARGDGSLRAGLSRSARAAALEDQ